MHNHIEKCILVYRCKFSLLSITQSIKPINSVVVLQIIPSRMLSINYLTSLKLQSQCLVWYIAWCLPKGKAKKTPFSYCILCYSEGQSIGF